MMKNFINLKDISTIDLRRILNDAKKRKNKRKNLSTLTPDKDMPLKNKLLVQMFEISSLRTRLSFYLAIKQLGGSALTLRPDELHFSSGAEPISDVAKILSLYSDIFVLRTKDHNKINEFSKFLSIPIINGLSPISHPAQILSDIFTIEELKKKPIKKIHVSWIGDANNVLNSLIEASVKFSFNLTIGCPNKYSPSKKTLHWAKKNNAKVFVKNNPILAVKNSDVIMTDKVISMNDKINKIKKIKEFKSFKIDKNLIKYAKKDVILLHCLPRGNEINDEVFNSRSSKVWLQALNRVCVQKSIILYCLNKLR